MGATRTVFWEWLYCALRGALPRSLQALAAFRAFGLSALLARTALAALAIVALGIAPRFNKRVEHFRPAPLEVAVLLETAL